MILHVPEIKNILMVNPQVSFLQTRKALYPFFWVPMYYRSLVQSESRFAWVLEQNLEGSVINLEISSIYSLNKPACAHNMFMNAQLQPRGKPLQVHWIERSWQIMCSATQLRVGSSMPLCIYLSWLRSWRKWLGCGWHATAYWCATSSQLTSTCPGLMMGQAPGLVLD